MTAFKNIFGRIWAVWGILSFITTFLIIFVPAMLTHLLPEPSSSRVFTRIAKIWMDIWLLLVGCPVRVYGKENFKKGEAYIVTCNHNSLMDVPLTSPYTPGTNKTIAKISFAKIPLFGLYYRKGSVLVDRKSDSSRKESFIKMKEVLAQGIHMCIYPEGTRNKTNEPLAKFHSGAFKLSMDTGKSIMPGIIFHTRRVLPANKAFYLFPHRLQLHFLPPIEPSTSESAEHLKERTHRTMKEYIVKHSAR